MNKVTVKFWHNVKKDKVAIAIYSSRTFRQGYCFLTRHGKTVQNMKGIRDWFDTLTQAREALKIHARLRNLSVLSTDVVTC